MRKYKIKKEPWYGFNHDNAIDMLGADRFCNEFTVKEGDSLPRAVYYSSNPDKSKGHKTYPMLHSNPFSDEIYISALDEEEMEKYRWYSAIYCHKCETILYSMERHHFNTCNCKKDVDQIHIDGGREYYAPRVLSGNNAVFEFCEIDMLTDEVRFNEETEEKQEDGK